jgi:hypothetical protein
MKTKIMVSITLILLVCLLTCSCSSKKSADANGSVKIPDIILIEDFSKEGGLSSLGTKWMMFTDQVMGGISKGGYTFETVDGKKCIRLQGDVSLENNGGFVQVALPLEIDGKAIDASLYKGVRLEVKGNNNDYYVHLRTNKTWLPWQFYDASFFAPDTWKTVEIPFSSFTPYSLKSKLNTAKLKRIAVVAFKKQFHADIYVSRIEFYR